MADSYSGEKYTNAKNASAYLHILRSFQYFRAKHFSLIYIQIPNHFIIRVLDSSDYLFAMPANKVEFLLKHADKF